MRGWQGFTVTSEQELEAKLREFGLTDRARRDPVAVVVVKVYGPDPGDSAVSIRMDDHRPLGETQVLAHDRLRQVVSREMDRFWEITFGAREG